MTDARLADIGERRLVNELLTSRYGTIPHFGDDSAVITTIGDTTVVATTDPAPEPVAWALGFRDYFHWGWLLAALNLSDLAAVGAKPLSLLTSLTLEASTSLADFTRLLDGIDACCSSVGATVIGGNLKEARTSRCEATAIGIVSGPSLLSRRGGVPGDVLLAFGPTGMFWSAYLALERDLSVPRATRDRLTAALLRPSPQVGLGTELRLRGVATACTDASDGLFAAVASLTRDRGVGAVVDPADMDYLDDVRRVASATSVDPFRLALGFGNLELVAAVRPDRTGAALDLAQSLGVHVTKLGVIDAEPTIRIADGGYIGELGNFDNERFTADSQFTAGIIAYRDRLLTQPLARR